MVSQQEKTETFPPEENEYMEIHWGTTPIGGDFSIAYFFDKDNRHCTRENMAYMNIVIYNKDGTRVNEVYGKNPFEQPKVIEKTIELQKAANKFAKTNGYKAAERIIEKDGWVYFRLLPKDSRQAAYLPDVIKINKSVGPYKVNDMIEKLRALKAGDDEAL